MQKDSATNQVTQMDPNEIQLYVMYRNQLAAPGGRTRDDLPYTNDFDALLHDYNHRTGSTLDEYDFWGLLKYVLKFGDEHIEVFLSGRGITVPLKP